MARPIKYDPATIWPVVLESIANGQSLSSILRQHDFPSYAWAKGQLRGNAELRRQYDEAVEDRADRLAEEMIELAYTPIPASLDGRGASAWVQHLRVKIETLKWSASKLRPRAYSERIDVTVQTPSISIIAALEAAQQRVRDGRTIDCEILQAHTPQLR